MKEVKPGRAKLAVVMMIEVMIERISFFMGQLNTVIEPVEMTVYDEGGFDRLNHRKILSVQFLKFFANDVCCLFSNFVSRNKSSFSILTELHFYVRKIFVAYYDADWVADKL